MANWPVHGAITGPIVMIGFGSIGRGILPLIERHFTFDKSRVTVIDPDDKNRRLLDERGITFIQKPVTRENFVEFLTPLLTEGEGQAFVVNLSVDVSSVAIMGLCHEVGALYIDTVAEPWLGFYTDARLSISERSNYALREAVLDLRRAVGPGPTAISCCGANPGMVSWFVKQALLKRRHRLRHRSGRAVIAGRLGAAGAKGRSQRRPYRGTRQPARPRAEAGGRFRQYVVRRRVHFGRFAARRTRLGNTRKTIAARR